MMKTLLAALFVVTTAGIAHAGGQEGTVGVGAEYQLSGLGGASVNYDAGAFHAGGFFAFYDAKGRNNTVFELGGRFYYHVATTAMSDFGVGGAIGLASVPDVVINPAAGTGSSTLLYVEPGIQIRVFIASNVALSVSSGLMIGTADADGVAVTGQSFTGAAALSGIGFTGSTGLHYYFF